MRKGFTLLELLIVVVVIGILASIAIPQFFRVAERARAAEAINILGAVRRAEIRYYSEHGVLTSSGAQIDLELPPKKFFTSFVMSTPTYTGGTEIMANAERSAASNPGYGNYVLQIHGNGDVTCTGGTKCPTGF